MNCSKSIIAPASIALGKWLKDARVSAGLNMRDLAAKLDCAHSFVGKYENAQRRLDVVEFVRVCAAIGVGPAAGLALVLQIEQADQSNSDKWLRQGPELYKWDSAKNSYVFVSDIPDNVIGLANAIAWYQAQKAARDQN